MRDDLKFYAARFFVQWRAALMGGAVATVVVGVGLVVGRGPNATIGTGLVVFTLLAAGFAVWREERKKLGFAEEELRMWRGVPRKEHDLAVEFLEIIFRLKRELGPTVDKQAVVRVFAPVLTDMEQRLFPELQKDEALAYQKDCYVFREWSDAPDKNAESLLHAVGWMDNKLAALAARTRSLVPTTSATRKSIVKSQ